MPRRGPILFIFGCAAILFVVLLTYSCEREGDVTEAASAAAGRLPLTYTGPAATPTTPPARPGDRRQRTKGIICRVFWPYCREAIEVARCETGGTFSVWAGWGKHQYLGLFQMGASERARYGHGWNAWDQSRAARRYFIATGRDWSPWTCDPDG